MSDKPIPLLAKVIRETELHTYDEDKLLNFVLDHKDFFVLNRNIVIIKNRENDMFFDGMEYLQAWKPEFVEKYKLLLEEE